MEELVLDLLLYWLSRCRVLLCDDVGTDTVQALTQLFLKHSWEQKKLPSRPSFRHVGHCRVPASLSHSEPEQVGFMEDLAMVNNDKQLSGPALSQMPC